MNGQDFKALLDALRGIQRAIEAKAGSSPEKVVNRFAEVFKMLDEMRLRRLGEGQINMAAEISEIMKKYAKIAEEVLNE